MKPFSNDNKLGKWILGFIQHYNHEKYWKRRAIVTDPNNKTPTLLKLYYLYYIKKCDAYHNCSFGTNLGAGAFFKTPPILLHGPNGIIIGKNCTIAQQVTISHGGGCTIGDNVLIGAGAKILGHVRIGNNVKIGANCVVVEDLPDNSTCVLSKPRIILR